MEKNEVAQVKDVFFRLFMSWISSLFIGEIQIIALSTVYDLNSVLCCSS